MQDPRAMLARIQSGMVPPDWRVVRPNGGFLKRQSIVYAVLGGAALIALVYILVSGTVYGIGVAFETSVAVLRFWQVLDIVVLVGMVMLFGYQFARMLTARRTVAEQFLVLMPDGFVMRTGADDKRTVAVGYREVSSMKVEDQVGNVFVVMRVAGAARPKRILIDGRFGRPRVVARQIAADYSMAVGPVPPGQPGQAGQFGQA